MPETDYPLLTTYVISLLITFIFLYSDFRQDSLFLKLHVTAVVLNDREKKKQDNDRNE